MVQVRIPEEITIFMSKKKSHPLILPVVTMFQLPELPNGCEATVLTTVLQYYGFPVDKVQIAYEYIPRKDFIMQGDKRYGPDPNNAYLGAPSTTIGLLLFCRRYC